MSLSQALREHVLRTLASVPLGQSIIVSAPEHIVEDICRLGFRVTCGKNLRAVDRSQFDWGVVTRDGSSWDEAVRSAVEIARSVRDGGWIIVGARARATEVGTGSPEATLRQALDQEPLAIAEHVSAGSDLAGRYVHAIIRRIGKDTPT